MSTQVTLVYSVTAQAPFTIARLEPIFANTELFEGALLDELGCTLVSDTTAITLQTAVRTIVISFFGTPNLYPVINPASSPFRGSVVSSSPNDKMGGSGLQTLTMNFINKDGLIQKENVQLNGTTPVPLLLPNKVTILSFTPTLGTPAGLIVLSGGAPANGIASGDRAAEILGNFTGTFVSTSESDSPTGAGPSLVSITYFDKFGAGPFVTTVVPNGQTPVPLSVSNVATITAVNPNTPNIGTLSIYTGDGTTVAGAPAATLPPSFNGSYPDGTDQAAPFYGLFTQSLSQGVGSIVTEVSVTLA
jgi:hypothetical protein